MTITAWQRLDKTGRNLAPFAVTVMLSLLQMVPVQLPSFSVVTPEFTLMAVFYWTVHRPDLLRPSSIFAIGLLQDLLTGGPLGLTALVLVVAHWVLLNQRRFFLASSFGLMWIGFALIALGAAVIEWLAVSALNLTPLPFEPALFQALLTLAMFPLLAWLFIRIHRAFLNG